MKIFSLACITIKNLEIKLCHSALVDVIVYTDYVKLQYKVVSDLMKSVLVKYILVTLK